jgi:hypothetical protein
MKIILSLSLYASVTLACFSAAESTPGSTLMFDDFERKYNDSHEVLASYGFLGKTKEGHQWLRRDFQKNGPDLHTPGILEFGDNNKALVWKGACSGNDIVYSDFKCKDFKLEFDYLRSVEGRPAFTAVINFRMANASSAVSDGGKPAGYALRIVQASSESLKVQISTKYGLEKSSTEVYTGKLGGHIKMIVKGNNIKVYIGTTIALDVTDNTANPSKNQAGFFSIQLNTWLRGKHGIDNWTVSAL